MKRREFIKNSALVLGLTTVISGCKNTDVIQTKGQVIRKKFHNITTPMIGLGTSRLPMNDGNINIAELEKMVQYAMDNGINYFDTGYSYGNFKAEIVLAKILKQYPREKYLLADKSPTHLIKSKKDVLKFFNEQLKKCQVEYFDNYMVHNINANTISKYYNGDVLNQLVKLKEQGRIKYLGFSSHGNAEILNKVIKEYSWDFCQLHINYQDWKTKDGEVLYKIADKANMPIIAMGPLRGGFLCNLPEKAAKMLKKQYPNETQASFGLRWTASRRRVVTILSGMSNLQQIKEQVETFKVYSNFSKQDDDFAQKIAQIMSSIGASDCTACKYCMEACPAKIDIASIFSIYNIFKSSNGDKDSIKRFVNGYYAIDKKKNADNCIRCNHCVKNCPQNIDIPRFLSKIDWKVHQLEEKNI